MNTTGKPVRVPTVTVINHACHLGWVYATTSLPGSGIRWVGLPAQVETRDRIRAAICNSGYQWPQADLTITVNPPVPAPDTGVDLPLALAVLAASGQLPTAGLAQITCLGELGLDGSLRTPRRLADRLGYAGELGQRCVVAPSHAGLAAPAGVRVWEFAGLRMLIDRLCGHGRLLGEPEVPAMPGIDLDALPARYHAARRAVEIAAAGGHHLAIATAMRYERDLFAQLLASLLPDLTAPVISQLAWLYPRAGLLPRRYPHRPPWQPVTYPVSVAELIGRPRLQPGLVSLAHAGVMLLDELPASGRGVADVLCEVLAHQRVTVTGSGRRLAYAAGLQLVLGLNTCGQHGCDQCPPRLDAAVSRHAPKLRRLLDHIDIHLAAPTTPQWTGSPLRPAAGTTAETAARVAHARRVAARRWVEHGWATNGQADPAAIDRLMPHRPELQPLLHRAVEIGTLSVPGVAHVKRLAMTIADLAAHTIPTIEDAAEAFWLRTGLSLT